MCHHPSACLVSSSKRSSSVSVVHHCPTLQRRSPLHIIHHSSRIIISCGHPFIIRRHTSSSAIIAHYRASAFVIIHCCLLSSVICHCDSLSHIISHCQALTFIMFRYQLSDVPIVQHDLLSRVVTHRRLPLPSTVMQHHDTMLTIAVYHHVSLFIIIHHHSININHSQL